MIKYLILLTVTILLLMSGNFTDAYASKEILLNQLFSFCSNHFVDGKDERKIALEKILKRYNSSLSSYAKFYVKYADKYNIDWKLLPAIAGKESNFGKYYIPGSHNVYGWGKKYITFDTWEDGIKSISYTLRSQYIDKGLNTISSLGSRYAQDG